MRRDEGEEKDNASILIEFYFLLFFLFYSFFSFSYQLWDNQGKNNISSFLFSCSLSSLLSLSFICSF